MLFLPISFLKFPTPGMAIERGNSKNDLMNNEFSPRIIEILFYLKVCGVSSISSFVISSYIFIVFSLIVFITFLVLVTLPLLVSTSVMIMLIVVVYELWTRS